MTPASAAENARRIAQLAWPVFVGQIAVLAFSTVDTVMAARVSAIDLAALAIGAAVYVSIFLGLMGTVLAIGPIAGQLYGAGRLRDAGHEAEQAVWLALALAAAGSAALAFPEPFLALAGVDGAVGEKVRAYLHGLGFALPPALVFTVFRGFNVAVSRPKAVMALQISGLALKVPLTAVLVFGFALPAPLDAWRLPALGAAGCGIATAIVMWLQAGAAVLLLRRDPFYAPFSLGRRLSPPAWASLGPMLKLGVPMGLSILVEVTGFTFMALFVARFGATAVAGHQIAVNMVALMFMMPLAIANATGTLVAQAIGGADAAAARRLGWHGMAIGCGLGVAVAGAVYAGRDALVGAYTDNASIVAAALPIVAWLALFHVVDAAQTVAAFVLRAWRIATLPLLVYGVAVWGVGLGGGYAAAFDRSGTTPGWMHGAQGFWAMGAAGLLLTAVGLVALLAFAARMPARPAILRLGPRR